MQSELTTSQASAFGAQGVDATLDLRKRRRPGEAIIQGFLLVCGFISIATTVGIVLVLLEEAVKFFGRPEVTIVEFLTGTTWQPKIEAFGIFPLLGATLLSSFIAMMVALPLGLMIAIYLSEYASPKARGILKPVLEVLAGIPTVVFGYFALTFVTPIVRGIVGTDTVEIFNVFSAGLVIGILILPLVSSMSEDALSAVPRALREASYAMGATKFQTAFKVVIPSAFSGIAAAFVIGVSRAIGETMVVAIAAGMMPNLTLNPIEPVQTLTAYIVGISLGDVPHGTIEYKTIFAAGITLFIMTLSLNVLGFWFRRKIREVY